MRRRLLAPLALLAAASAPPPRLILRAPHHDEVHRVGLSDDGRLVATADRGGVAQVWALPEGLPVLRVAGLPRPVEALALSEGALFVEAGGARLAWALASGEALAPDPDAPPLPWRAGVAEAGSLRVEAAPGGARVRLEGQPEQVLGGRSLPVLDVIWHESTLDVLTGGGEVLRLGAEGAHRLGPFPLVQPAGLDLTAGGGLLLADAGGPASLVDARGELLHHFAGHAATVSVVVADPTGWQAASGARDGSLVAWDLKRQSATRGLPGHGGEVRALAWSGAGRLASGGADGVVRVFETEGWSVVFERHGLTGGVRALAWSDDGQRLVAADGAGGLRAWDARGEPAWSQDLARPATALLGGDALWVASGGALLAHAFADGAASGEPVALPAEATALLRVGDGLAVGDIAGGVGLIDAATGAPRWRAEAHAGRVTLLAFDPRAGELLSAGRDGLRRWDAATGRARGRGPKPAVTAGALTADGARLLLGRAGGALGLWAPEGWAFLGRLEGDPRGARVALASPDGELIVTGGVDGHVRAWHAASGSSVDRVRHRAPVTALALDARGERSASGDAKGGLLLWSVDRAADLRELDGVGVSVTALAFVGEALWVGDAEGGLHHVPLDGGEALAWAAHAGPVRGLAPSPDGARLASAGEDGLVRLWDAEAPAPLGGFDGGWPWLGLAWSPDGGRLALQALDHVALRPAEGGPGCALVLADGGWQLIDAQGAWTGEGEVGLALLMREGALSPLPPSPEPAVLAACLGR